jgi:hypothetical protein
LAEKKEGAVDGSGEIHCNNNKKKKKKKKKEKKKKKNLMRSKQCVVW